MIFETFSHRKKKRLRSGEAEIFSYDQVGPQLRHQLCMALHEGIGQYQDYSNYNLHSSPNANKLWEEIDRVCLKEIYAYLDYLKEQDLSQRYFNFLTNTSDIDDFLSALEVSCNILLIVDASQPAYRAARTSGRRALEEINTRFLQHAVGYRFENKILLRVDSEFVHSEIIKPALQVLSNKDFAVAENEFRIAHSHYRLGAYKDAVTASNRAFESTLKTICDLRGWEYGKGDRASELITLVNSQGLFTHSFDKAFNSLIAWLKSGLPTIRNDAGAHGDGLRAKEVTAHIARFAINSTAANIMFLAEAARSGQ